MIIHQTVDNNEEYAPEQMAGAYAVDDARDSIFHSPMTVDGKELFDPSHDRHPSSKNHEVPLHDDMDESKEHNRFASVIRKDVPDMDSLERNEILKITVSLHLSVISVLFSISILRNLSLIQIESTVFKFRFRSDFLNHFDDVRCFEMDLTYDSLSVFQCQCYNEVFC